MKFSITFEISPTAPFGLPDDGCTVTPAGDRVSGGAYHPGAMERISWGSMSVYRPDDSAISRDINLGDVSGVINDNYVKLEVDAATSREAYDKADRLVSDFLRHLTALGGRVYSHTPKIIEGENNTLHRIPKYVMLMVSTTYDLDTLNENIEEAEKYAQLQDERLDRGLHYLEHALLLYENKSQIAAPMSRQQKYLISAVFLNFWKSIAALVGDPAKKGDRYQKRINDLGLSNEIKDGIGKVKEFRDEYDVAHYTLDEAVVNSLEGKVGIARSISSALVKRYCEALIAKI